MTREEKIEQLQKKILHDNAELFKRLAELQETPAKVLTRGEEVTERLVTETGDRHVRFHGNNFWVDLWADNARGYLKQIRSFVAAAIDAERQSARDAALDEAAELAFREVSANLAAQVRALKGAK